MSYSQPLVRRHALGNPYAWIVDAAAQAGTTTAKVAAGTMQAAERNAKRLAEGKKLELEGEKILTSAELELARAQAEALRIQASTAALGTEKNTGLLIAGAAGLGVVALLTLVMFR